MKQARAEHFDTSQTEKQDRLITFWIKHKYEVEAQTEFLF